MMQKRNLLTLLALSPVLGACGFRLRGAQSFVFRSLYIQAAADSPVARQLHAVLAASGNILVLREPLSPDSAEAILQILGEQQERVVVGMNALGQVRELQLRLRLRYRLRTPGGAQPIGETELLQQRDVTYNETNALAKSAEEGMLYQDMRTDIVQQVLRQLAAIKSLGP